MFSVPLEKPSPDFESLDKVIRGEKDSERVHFVELGIDPEIMAYITQRHMNKKFDREVLEHMQGRLMSKSPTFDSQAVKERCQKETIDFYYRMGYDYVVVGPEYENLPQFKRRTASDTAAYPRTERSWIGQEGIVSSWNDFRKIDWEKIKPDYRALDYARKYLPEGMKILVCDALFLRVLADTFGYENLFIFSHEKPDLVQAVFAEWGKKVFQFYEEAVQYPEVGAIFHGDDLAYKAGTMLSPTFFRKNVFPWYRKYASLAHEQEKAFWLHCCGNIDEVMEDLIEYVKIDALHSFEDECCSVLEYKRKYGDRIGILGGVDMDKLVRMSEQELRDYVRRILDECLPGRYALGSGNTIANYLPVRNYLIMLDEGLKWRG